MPHTRPWRAAAGNAAHSHGEEGDGFTRAIQMNIGMGLGVLAFSLAIGALFAVVFAVAYGRVGGVSARLLSLYVAGGMLLSLYIVPALKYPAESARAEPGRDDPAAHAAVPVDGRGVGGAVRRRGLPRPAAGGPLGRVERRRWSRRGLRCGGRGRDGDPADHRRDAGPLVDDAGTIVYAGFPADVLYEFRLYSLGTQVVIYATIGLVFAALVSRLLGERKRSGRGAVAGEIPAIAGE